jgi:hypothetical protein
MTSLETVIATYSLTIPNKQRDNWRWTFPNTGELIGFERFGFAMIHATNGILAYYRVDDSGSLWLGHLACFTGPIAKEYVFEEDWDYENHKRRVSVFKRKDGSIVIIPKDWLMDWYWSKCDRMSQEEHKVWAEVGHSITIAQVEEHLKRLGETKTFKGERVVRKEELTKRQKLLATI